jgi:hypothetical protein
MGCILSRFAAALGADHFAACAKAYIQSYSACAQRFTMI